MVSSREAEARLLYLRAPLFMRGSLPLREKREEEEKRERDRSEDTLLDAMETKYSSRGKDFLSFLVSITSLRHYPSSRRL